MIVCDACKDHIQGAAGRLANNQLIQLLLSFEISDICKPCADSFHTTWQQITEKMNYDFDLKRRAEFISRAGITVPLKSKTGEVQANDGAD